MSLRIYLQGNIVACNVTYRQRIHCQFSAAWTLATIGRNNYRIGTGKCQIIEFDENLTGGGNKLALGFIQGSSNRIIVDDWANPADLYSNHFQGLMDDLRIFKVALSEADVAALYAAEKPWWRNNQEIK